LRLGDEYQGGKIFKLNTDGKTGLISSTLTVPSCRPRERSDRVETSDFNLAALKSQ
jgi:hypothetical protein